MEVEEQVYPCKGCGDILEEGKAFELAGNRWHIDCFRCNTCGTLLDSDANLLLLGDGSLICNNCTYSCSACGNKIEDLAILTGDQAFCANCFKCRNCKRKIDNLRYARTSQGIFCMSCHESLMARRRKRSKMPRTASANSNASGQAPVVLDKSLPALPPHAVAASAFPPPDSDNVTLSGSVAEQSPSSIMTGNPMDQKGQILAQFGEMGLISAAENVSQASSVYATPAIDGDFHIPITFDTREDPPNMPPANRNGEQAGSSEYPGVSKHSSTSAIMRDDYQDLVAGSSRSVSTDGFRPKRSPALPAPHIASLQRGRQSSSEMADTLRKRQSNDTPSTTTSPTAPTFDKTRLSPAYEPTQDPLDRAGQRLTEPTSRSRASLGAPESKHSSVSGTTSPAASGAAGPFEDSVQQELRRRGSFKRSPLASPVLQGGAFDRPARDDSLTKAITRKEVPNGDSAPAPHERKGSLSTIGRKDSTSIASIAGKPISRPIAAGVTSTLSADGLPMRSPRRPGSALPDEEGEFVAPRNAPPPPPPIDHRHRVNQSISSIQSEHFSTGDLTPTADDPERGDDDGPAGLFRRVSKAVKHGRSHSDKISAMPSMRYKRNGSTDISSPILASPNSAEETIQLRNKLRFAQQRVTELEAEKNALEERVNGTVDLRQMNTELREKRSTMAFLDTQREMVIRELEVMTDHLSKAKDSRGLSMETFQAEVLRDFAASLSKLKDQMSGQIEELVQRKNDITTQISSLLQMKDKGYQEYEALSTKNAQLSEVNNQLIQNIQDMYKQSRQPGAPPPPPLAPTPTIQSNVLPPNGLGIYTHSAHKDSVASELKPNSISDSMLSGEIQVEGGTMLGAPQVVDIRKAKKFNWKKGGALKNAMKSAFGPTSQQQGMARDDQFLESAPYGSMPAGEAPTQGALPFNQSRAGGQPANNAWGGFLAAPRPPHNSAAKPSSRDGTPTSSTLTIIPSALPAESALFGSDLVARCTFEKSIIPTIVARCISEVEIRGLNVEGIYRKSGSSSQIKMIQAGFEKDWSNFDISDEELDVHAVTSALKQYFRRLPNPLITFDAYEGLLEAVGGPEGAKEVKDGGDVEMARRLRRCVDGLPRCHRDTLEFLIEHLCKVKEDEAVNLMTNLNLAVVFAPTIMRSPSIEREMSDMHAQRVSVQCMLQHPHVVFGDE